MEQSVWMEQFSKIEAGIPTTWKELYRLNHASQDEQVPLEPDAFPDAWQIQCQISKLKRDKVAGPNHLPPALYKAGGEIIARQLAILYTKTAARCREPLMWKGGLLVPLWKGKDSPDLPSAYRSIFISGYTAKLYHQAVRVHLVRAWEDAIQHMQCGGRKGIGVDVAHHVIQSHQAWAKECRTPTAIIFLDLRSAFYTVLRQAFTCAPTDDTAFIAAMMQLGVTPQELADLTSVAAKDNATEALPMHQQAVLRDMMRQTFFMLPGLPDPCHTTRGTRPGDPVADVFFKSVHEISASGLS